MPWCLDVSHQNVTPVAAPLSVELVEDDPGQSVQAPSWVARGLNHHWHCCCVASTLGKGPRTSVVSGTRSQPFRRGTENLKREKEEERKRLVVVENRGPFQGTWWLLGFYWSPMDALHAYKTPLVHDGGRGFLKRVDFEHISLNILYCIIIVLLHYVFSSRLLLKAHLTESNGQKAKGFKAGIPLTEDTIQLSSR